MTAAPTAPGRGLPVYQPATAVLDGTWRGPFGRRPGWTSAGRPAVDRAAGGGVGEDGAAIGDGLAGSGTVCWGDSAAAARPVLPTATATSPPASASAASRRRGVRRSQGSRRDVHNPRVVARTCPQAGGGLDSSGSG